MKERSVEYANNDTFLSIVPPKHTTALSRLPSIHNFHQFMASTEMAAPDSSGHEATCFATRDDDGSARAVVDGSTAYERWSRNNLAESNGAKGSGTEGNQAPGIGDGKLNIRNCRGCLYFSRSLMDEGRRPLCFGMSRAQASMSE